MATPFRQDRGTLADLSGAPPQMATVQGYDPITEGNETAPAQIRKGQGGRAGHARTNMAAVIDVLLSYGMDPAEEIARALTEMKPVVTREGTPVVDPQTGEPLMAPVLDADARTKIHMELLQYTRPKLKAVEVQIKPNELTDDQIDRRLERLMAEVAKKGA